MSDLAPIALDALRAPETPPAETPAPDLQWIEIARLRVDHSYQREIVKAGRRNIEKIAAEFDWRKFAPVIVAPIKGGLFAIVDGQHRTIAAWLIDKASVPCAVIQADRRMQAEAFAAVNGNVTRMSALSVFRAAVGAGDPDAVALRDLAADCGVRILGYPKAAAQMRPGDCTSPAALTQANRRFGAILLRKALLAIMAQPDPRGLVNPAFVRGLCVVFERLPFALATENVARVFGALDLRACHAESAKWGDELHDVVLRRLASIAKRGAQA